MILDVTAAGIEFGIEVGKLAKNCPRCLAHDACKHVQTASVGHPHHDFFNSLVCSFVDRQFEQRNESFGPFQREALGILPLFQNKFFENDRVTESFVNTTLFFASQFDPVFGRFHPPLKPFAHRQVVNMHELHTD